VHVAYYYGNTGDLRYLYRPAGGAFGAFTAIDGANNVGQYAALVVEPGTTPVVHIAYLDATLNDLKYARRTGTTGTFTVSTIDSSGNAVGSHASLAVSAAGVFIAYYDATIGDLKLAVQPPGGQFFIVPVESRNNTGTDSSIVVNAAGDVTVIYRDGDVRTLLASSRKAGGWWRTEVAEASANNVGQYADVAVANDGTVHLSYYDTVGDLRYASRSLAGAWTPAAAVTTNSVGTYSNICIDPSGAPIIAYYDATATDLLLATRQSNGAFVSSPIDVSAGAAIGTFASMACDADGGVFVSYYDATNLDLKFASRAPGSASFLPQAIDTTGSTGSQTSIALAPNGEPRVAFFTATGNVLRLARRTGGATWSADPIEAGLAASPNPSVGVLPNGVELVAYNLRRCVAGCAGTPVFTFDLQLAQRAADGGFSRVRIEDVGSNGIQSSFAVDRSGMAHILYYDPTNQDLRHAFRCP
jgi:hypothetical protein